MVLKNSNIKEPILTESFSDEFQMQLCLQLTKSAQEHLKYEDDAGVTRQ